MVMTYVPSHKSASAELVGGAMHRQACTAVQAGHFGQNEKPAAQVSATDIATLRYERESERHLFRPANFNINDGPDTPAANALPRNGSEA
jgi:hypothetical protein